MDSNDGTDGSGDDDGSDKGKVVIDDSVPKEMQEQIQSLLNTLPTVISNQDVKIVLNMDVAPEEYRGDVDEDFQWNWDVYLEILGYK
ncbi:MAG: hypothetical protein NC308_04295 [Clostridium sp.]|nr:hypothetical protein [Bacteroides sp.]MCM1198087.1 hypothetical protein [Clostridium sp.]